MNTNAENHVDEKDLLAEKVLDAAVPGYQVEFDPDEAEQLGAFEEDGISEVDALESSSDDGGMINIMPTAATS